MPRKTTAKTLVRCHRCAERSEAWRQDLTENRHGCAACKNVFDAGSWRSNLLRIHRSLGRDLVCPDCAQRGFSPGKYEAYDCTECLGHFGSAMFNKMILYNSKRNGEGRPRSRLVCKACKTKLRCSSCRTAFERGYWSYNERGNHSNSRTKLVCSACRAKGFHPRDIRAYMCQTCAGTFGSRKSVKTQIHNYNSNNSKTLRCLQCISVENERVRLLRHLPRHKTDMISPLLDCVTFDELSLIHI